ncbi:Mitogen-activated protein kinase kinase kinase 1 [Linum grandiflorum]
MEDSISSTGSSTSQSPPPPPPPYHRPRSRPTEPIADRIFRALRHDLRLLHRSESSFFVLGATGNVYTVSLTSVPSCTCPDRTSPCKHIFFVLIRVLGVPLDDSSLRRRTLRPCLLSRLLSSPSSPESLAGVSVRRRFHQLFFDFLVRRQREQQQQEEEDNKDGRGVARVQIEEGAMCPICMDDIVKTETGEAAVAVAACGTCRNVVHQECLRRWKRSRGRRGATCVICRARWRGHGDDDRRRCREDKYLNLGAYVCEDSTCGLVRGESGGNFSTS